MNIDQIDWQSLRKLEDGKLLDTTFEILAEASVQIQRDGDGHSAITDLVPRLLDLASDRQVMRHLGEPIACLARSTGLWNYIDELDAPKRERLIAESARIGPLSNRVLHREQWRALGALLEGRNVVLSAPTSFGKSLLIDALILSGKYSKIAVIVPTIALLDETRRRLSKLLSPVFDVISHSGELVTGEHVVFIGTQERLIAREDIGDLDLLVVDEFYKLDPSRKDERSAILNAAVYRLISRSNQFFFLGPNIDSIRFADSEQWRFEFIKTKFSTVAVDTLDLSTVEDRESRLAAEVAKAQNMPALVFASSPDRANKISSVICSVNGQVGQGASSLAEWMRDNYWSEWELCSNVNSGVAVHHARIPRALASKIVHEFNAGSIGALVCTSTLIEGVNTAARSVLIYDKKISKSDFDFFTFSNIRGRAGRLGQHYVGKVFLFNSPPEIEEVGVDAPLFQDLDEAPDELIVHLMPEDLSDSGRDRVMALSADIGLPPSLLSQFSSLSIEVIRAFKNEVQSRWVDGGLPEWNGYPKYEDIQSVNDIICSVKSPVGDFGVSSSRQLTFYLNQLRHCSTMSEFFAAHRDSPYTKPETYDRVFKFLRSCEYGLGEYYMLVEALINAISGTSADFSLFVAEMRNYFRPEPLKALDERGVPIQLSERVYLDGDGIDTLEKRLIDTAVEGQGIFSEFEKDWIVNALA